MAMSTTPGRTIPWLAVAAFVTAATLPAQFRDDFVPGTLARDPQGITGWTCTSGDGAAVIDIRPTNDGHAAVVVDATKDTRDIWWAIIRRCVSAEMDLAQLARPGRELRVEARLRTSHAPRRVNLHFNTQRTTDYYSHLMEYDIPEAGVWHTISMTTRDFDAVPGDRVFVQMAMMDWGTSRYEVDVDYLRADIVDVGAVGPDLGEPQPYHPPVPDPATFRDALPVAHDSTVDLQFPDRNFNHWSSTEGGAMTTLLNVDGTQRAILRWDFSALAGRKVVGGGLLELTTHDVLRPAEREKDYGEIRVVEILAGDPAWDQAAVTLDSLCQGRPLEEVFNTQMIIDVPVADGRGAKTLVTISRPVMQRLLDGRTRGLVLVPLGAINASFLASENESGAHAPRLLFNLVE
jgi:hypothetical protein